MKKTLLFLPLALALVNGCKKDEDVQQCEATANYNEGALIVNQGAFQGNNGSITYVSDGGSATQQIFADANGIELGDVVQSLSIAGDLAYIVVNNSFKVEVVNRSTFERVATIADAALDYPRYTVDAHNGKTYLSNGAFGGKVFAIDQASHELLGSIDVGSGPEQMVYSNNYVFVANSGGWGMDSTVSVINTSTDEVVETIELSHRPVDLDVDGNGHVWVLCSGETLYDADWNVIGNTPAMVHQIDGNTFEVMESIQFGLEGDHPVSMTINQANQSILVVAGGIHQLSISDLAAGWQQWAFDLFQTVDYDPFTQTVWAADVPTYTSSDMVHQLNTSGQIVESIEAGIAPTHIVFAH
ncbi:MAG: hypothetical protein KDC12_12080 [Flavobacteriales bacterium]|nr:hypothetical protein [Flavobacteriales bacterium]